MTAIATAPVRVSFEQGTIVVELNGHPLPAGLEITFVRDHRVAALRGEACHYRGLLEGLVAAGTPFEDAARAYDTLDDYQPVRPFKPYPHQAEALEAWKRGGRAGVIVLPTGSGKTYLAEMAMQECRRATLVVVPTLDLVSQWVNTLEATFGVKVGLIGGGEFTVQPVTVITYDSAVRHIEHLGNRFGFIVFDECHHLPGEVYSNIARMALAPFRLGLTATPDRADGGEVLLEELVGPTLYASLVSALAGDILAPYRTQRVEVELSPEERKAYASAREQYLSFCRSKGIRLGAGSGWGEFLQQTARSKAGREAFAAYRMQRNIPLMATSKFEALAQLLLAHRQDRIIIFTHVNELAYHISRTYLVPVITHQTPPRERSEILARFAKGSYPAVVTSKVLNEGVDVPEANVGIILSGSGSIREHVQRLGRILRRREGKEAWLYEFVTRDTHEESMSRRRREHEAYRRPSGGHTRC